MIGLLLTFCLFLLTGREVYSHITLNYGADPTGDAFASAYLEDELLSQAEVTEGKADLFFWGSRYTSLAPIHYNTYEEIYLESIQIRAHGHLICDLQGAHLGLRQEPQFSSPFLTQIEACLQSWDWILRPRLV